MSHAFGPSSGRQEGSAEPPVVLSKGPEDTSLRLVRLIQQGIDRDENFRRLFELHRPRVQNFFRKKGFSQQEIADLTQDVFLRVFKSIDTFRGDSTFEWWLKEVADSVYKNELRRRGAEKRDGIEQSLDARSKPDDDSSRPLLELLSPDASPLAQAERQEQIARIRAALLELPPQMRQCCLLRYQEGLKYQEIAKVMKISIETVKAHLFQARKRLIAQLGGKGST
jgi:RNA polymerase sigma-70 factor (ECF subfamily)